ncbi:hypothetical protein [Acidimangrovimonas pyrenivorans]|uniref:Uncharacterized protein n=1 Tax=Acidimangrovimonas pyrenivorans TaxID=2030798 RepID=A0ABV7AEW7_9RHOB
MGLVLLFVGLALLSSICVFALSLAVYFALPYLGFPQNPPAGAATSGAGWPLLSVQVDSGDDRQLLISIQSWLATLLGFVFAAVGFMLSHRKEQMAVKELKSTARRQIETAFKVLKTSCSTSFQKYIDADQETWNAKLDSLEKKADAMEEELIKGLGHFPEHVRDLQRLLWEIGNIGDCITDGRSKETRERRQRCGDAILNDHLSECEKKWPIGDLRNG